MRASDLATGLPGHMTHPPVTDAVMFARAVLKGDAGRREMIEQSSKDTLAEYVPGRR